MLLHFKDFVPKHAFAIGVFYLIGVALIVLCFLKSFYIIDSDLSYHLATAESLVRQGGIAIPTLSHFAPLGGPRLYPPVIAIILALLLLFHLSPLTIIMSACAMSIITLLSVSWYALSRLFNPKVGLLYLFIITSYLLGVKMIGNVIPSSLVLFSSPLLIVFIKNKKTAAASLLLGLFFYTHMALPWIIAAATVVWALYNKEFRKTTWKVVGISLAIALPWFIYVVGHLEYVRYVATLMGTNVDHTLTPYIFDLNILILFIGAAFVLFWKYRTKQIHGDSIFFIAFLIFSLPIAFIGFLRFSYSVGFFPITVLIAYAASEYKTYIPRKYTSLTALVFIIIVLCGVVVTINKKISFQFQPHLFLDAISSTNQFYLGHFPKNHFNQTNYTLAKSIAQNTTSNAQIFNLASTWDNETLSLFNQYDIPQFFAALSNRRMANPRSYEYNWRSPISINQTDILLINQNQLNAHNDIAINDTMRQFLSPQEQLTTTISLKNFTLIATSPTGLDIFKNNNVAPSLSLPKSPVFPLYLSIILVFGALGYIAYCLIF